MQLWWETGHYSKGCMKKHLQKMAWDSGQSRVPWSGNTLRRCWCWGLWRWFHWYRVNQYVCGDTFMKQGAKSHDLNLQSIDHLLSRMFVIVKINELHSIKLKVFTGVNICMIYCSRSSIFPFSCWYFTMFYFSKWLWRWQNWEHWCMFPECYIQEEDYKYIISHSGGTRQTIHAGMQTVLETRNHQCKSWWSYKILLPNWIIQVNCSGRIQVLLW